MVRIAAVLAGHNVPFQDAGLGWGAKASAYGTQPADSVSAGYAPVLVEIEVDCEVPEGTIVVDHHGSRAGEPASILQVLALLGIEPSRLDMLIAANDSGYIPGLFALGATPEEIEQVRLLDRSTQGVTPEMEQEATRALAEANAYQLALAGDLVVVHLAHSKCATISDRLFPHWKCGERLLILSGDGEVNFFGNGALCAALQQKFQGWSGGSGLGQADKSAYWGGYLPHGEVEKFVRDYYNQ